jgi:hypothetical protein
MPDLNQGESPEELRVKNWQRPAASRYNVKNPLKIRRVFFDCLSVSGGKQVAVNPGETLENVEIADHVAKKLMADHDDLVVTPAASQKPFDVNSREDQATVAVPGKPQRR